jgi:hypothetical protein
MLFIVVLFFQFSLLFPSAKVPLKKKKTVVWTKSLPDGLSLRLQTGMPYISQEQAKKDESKAISGGNDDDYDSYPVDQVQDDFSQTFLEQEQAKNSSAHFFSGAALPADSGEAGSRAAQDDEQDEQELMRLMAIEKIRKLNEERLRVVRQANDDLEKQNQLLERQIAINCGAARNKVAQAEAQGREGISQSALTISSQISAKQERVLKSMQMKKSAEVEKADPVDAKALYMQGLGAKQKGHGPVRFLPRDQFLEEYLPQEKERVEQTIFRLKNKLFSVRYVMENPVFGQLSERLLQLKNQLHEVDDEFQTRKHVLVEKDLRIINDSLEKITRELEKRTCEIDEMQKIFDDAGKDLK